MNSVTSHEMIPCRRFGRTELQIPVLSLGGMRFQQSWKDLNRDEIEKISQYNVEKILKKSILFGLHHIETARHYGTSEVQLGIGMKNISDKHRILQTKIPPKNNPQEFEADLELSFRKLGCKRIDLLSIHGINLPEHLDQTLRPGGCLDVVKKWQEHGKIGFIGFSTHAETSLILKAIESNAFDYVNLHWYFIRQVNEPVLDAANRFDLGVFIISPTDKGGHLHTPSKKLSKLCMPLHPIVFNDLFCLRDDRVHTISVGLSRIEDLDLHLKAVSLLDNADNLVTDIQRKLEAEAYLKLGHDWLNSWYIGLPDWNETPGNINLPVLLWLHNLIQAWDMKDYAKARYSLLGKAGHWFPGNNADKFDQEVSEIEIRSALSNSPWVDHIPDILRALKRGIGGQERRRLWSN